MIPPSPTFPYVAPSVEDVLDDEFSSDGEDDNAPSFADMGRGAPIRLSSIASAAFQGQDLQPLLGEQLVFKGIISSSRTSQHVEIMGDSGCASIFINESHARAHKYDLIPLNKPTVVELADGSPAAQVTHMT